VDLETGTNTSTCRCRKKPVSGSTGGWEETGAITAILAEIEVNLGMIWPHHGIRRERV
jgi:hypothetical protein